MLGSWHDEPPIMPPAPVRSGKRGQRRLLLRDNVLTFALFNKDGLRIWLNRRWLNSTGSAKRSPDDRTIALRHWERRTSRGTLTWPQLDRFLRFVPAMGSVCGCRLFASSPRCHGVL